MNAPQRRSSEEDPAGVKQASAMPAGLSSAEFFGSARSGRGLPPNVAVEAWATAAWLLAVEGRAYLEDLEGGHDQPLLRRLVRVKLLEVLYDIDTRIGGSAPLSDDHHLAMALEYGLREVVMLKAEEIEAIFSVAESETEPAVSDGPVYALWERILDSFPGELPDPLRSEGQREILRALRNWSKLCAAAGVDAAFLEPFLKEA